MKSVSRTIEAPVRARRTPNRRGQGSQLRDEIVEAASEILAASGDVRQLTLRGVARKVGIAATSVYLHFSDVRELALAFADRRFQELSGTTAAAREGISDPMNALIASCQAYCRFALDNPGHYRVMFEADLAVTTQTEAGRRSFDALVAAVGRCVDPTGGHRQDASRVAALVFAGMHGIVTLRITRPYFPWRPLDEMVEELVRRLVATGQNGVAGR